MTHRIRTNGGGAVPGRGQKIVVLGVMSRLPIAGIVWQTVHYLLGFQRLGYDVHYVEAHACTPKMLMQSEDDDGSARAAAFIAGTMRRFGLGGRWAFHALHADGRYYGMSERQLKQLYGSAALIINLHGATQPLPEHGATGRLVYLETDPVVLQIELYHNVRYTLDFLEQHCAFFTFGENYGKPDCGLPVSDRFDFRPTRQPVVVDLWRPYGDGDGRAFTTVGSWKQTREITLRGEVYGWSKHQEFMRFLDLPARANREFELALAGCAEADRLTLESKGWSVREALALSANADAYRRYIARSRGEFTVAKDQNVRLRSGWFSDRSATYLAAGRPVVTQETGFSNILPTGEGLFAFSEMDEAAEAVERIDSDYARHRRTATALAEEYFSYDVVLTRFLADLGLPSPVVTSQPEAVTASDADSTGVGPTTTPQGNASVARVSPDGAPRVSFPPRCSIIIPVYNNAALTRRCLDALLGTAAQASFEVVVVDDASTDATRRLLAGYGGRIRTVRQQANKGFSAACNAGAAVASGEYLVFLNSDVLPEADWLDALVRYAESHPRAAAVGSKLLFPDGTIQHAGVVVCHDLHPRHLYAGFPADHPAVNKSRRFQIVTAASILLRRGPFEEAGGFDVAFRNGFEDADLCLRLDERGHEVHYCHESVGHHLEAVSEGRSNNEEDNLRLYLDRWARRVRPDDLGYYVEDGLLSLGYAHSYPARLTVSPLLAVLDDDELQAYRLLNTRSRQAFELLKETARLTVRVEEAELRAAGAGQAGPQGRISEATEGEAARRGPPALWHVTSRPREGSDAPANDVKPAPSSEEELRAMLLEAHEQLRRRDDEIETLVHDLQANLAAALRRDARNGGGNAGVASRDFVPGKYLSYRQLVRRIREVVRTNLPPGATVVVVSRGDEALIELGDGRRGWHFPQEEGGVYAGYYPADGAEAIAHLEELRFRGGEFLLFPETSFWWLEHYGGFREYLKDRYRLLVRREETCLIFDLRGPEAEQYDASLPATSKDSGKHRRAPA
jgi:GT2 family glycosyltransferase